MVVHPRKRPRYRVEVPLASLIDIVFLLLVYFLLTTNFIAQEGIRVHLPRATSEASALQDEVTVVVSASGKVYLGSERVTLHDLFLRLKDRVGREPDMVAVVKADRSLVLDRVVQVMDVIKSAGIRRLRLATERGEP